MTKLTDGHLAILTRANQRPGYEYIVNTQDKPTYARCRRLAARGLFVETSRSKGLRYYRITDAGRAALQEASHDD